MDTFDGLIISRTKIMTVVYKLTHLATGKFYIGSTGNYVSRSQRHVSLLRANKHHLKELQKLYNEAPHFRFEIDALGIDIENPEIREKAYDREQALLDENKDNPLLLNKSLDARAIVLSDVDEKERQLKIKLAYQRPGIIAWQTEKNKRIRQNPEARAQQSSLSINAWRDPEFRAKQMATRNTPEFLRNHIESQPTAKKVVVAGQEFLSIKNASIVLHMSRATIKQRLKDPQFHDYYFTDSIT